MASAYPNHILAWTAAAALKILPKPNPWTGPSRFNNADGPATADDGTDEE